MNPPYSQLSESRSVMSDSLWPHRLYSPWNSPGQNTGVGSRSLLQGIFPAQGSNPGLQHFRWILYQLSHEGSPRTLEWVAYHFSNRSSRSQESNQGLLHCRHILYQLSYQGSPKVPQKEESPGEGNGNTVHYSCLGNPMERGAWSATVHGGSQRVGHNLATKTTVPVIYNFYCCVKRIKVFLKML